ncbi:hypothetical protein AALF15_01290 [Corynebacteriaceae bacterium 7-707]
MTDFEVGIARFTVEYGLDVDGQAYITEEWENLTDPGADVPMVTRAGLLAMSQQTLTAEVMGHFDDEGE